MRNSIGKPLPVGCGACLLLPIILAAGCQKPVYRIEIATTQPVSTLTGSPFDPAVTPRYTLYPGDRLMIRYPTEATLDQEVRVRSDGFISLPYVGDVQAAGRSPSELTEDLNNRYATAFVKPNVAVIVVEEAGRRVYLGGQVRDPGSIPLQANQTLSQAIFEAGGILMQGRSDSVIVIRNVPGDATYVLKADVSRILAGAEADVRLAPADVVHVPETVITKVDQFVEQYINAVMPRSMLWNFTTYTNTQRVRVVSNQQSIPPVTITR